jgi:superfamily I DNA and/or RNA helicase
MVCLHLLSGLASIIKRYYTNRHEHLYFSIEHKIIRTDTLEEDKVGVEHQLEGARVMLCTLSMFSNRRIIQCGLPEIVPIETVIIDEASQIEVGDYLPLFHRFRKTLRKLVYIGDDKQRNCNNFKRS